MNIACPRCGTINDHIHLPLPPRGSTTPQQMNAMSYVCLAPADGKIELNADGHLIRCGQVFRVDLQPTAENRALREYELVIALKGYAFADQEDRT